MTERLYYSDSTLTRFHSRIADIRLVSRNLSRIEGSTLWQVALESSAFYPTSGGQPHDTGALRATSRSGAILEIPVISVEEDDQGEVWHTVEKPLSAGTEVEGIIDRPRRLDHMQQHSGQHLLSAVFAREWDALTTSFHLGEQSSTIDLAIDLESDVGSKGGASVSSQSPERTDRLGHVERIANEVIATNRSISIRTVSPQEARSLLESGQVRKLPERDGPVRLIEIDDYDLNACGGTHVQFTGQIGALLLRSTERVRNGLRVEFVCGLRAVATARRDYELLSTASAALSVSRAMMPEAVERLLTENKSAAKERQKLLGRLADAEAVQLIAQATPVGDGLEVTGLKVIRRVFDNRIENAEERKEGTIDADYCKLLASCIVATAPDTLVLFASVAASLTPSAMIIVAGSKGQPFSCGDLLRTELARLGMRGGGSREMAQGQVPSDQAGPLLDRLEAAARAETSKGSEQHSSSSTYGTRR